MKTQRSRALETQNKGTRNLKDTLEIANQKHTLEAEKLLL